MLCSFADVVSLSPHTFVRPVLQYEGPLVVKEGYHPVIVNMSIQQMKSSFVPNDFFMSPLDNMRIISGPNGSGKVIQKSINGKSELI